MDVYTPASAPSGPITLGQVTRTLTGNVMIALPDGETYDIEYSPDLTPGAWSVIQTEVSGSYEDTDSSRTQSGRDFYRGVRK